MNNFGYFCVWFQVLLFQNGFLSCLPYICDWITIMITSQIADCLRSKGILSTGAVRKFFNSVGKKGDGTELWNYEIRQSLDGVEL